MPFLLVYSASDFVGGLPAESGAAAAGRGPFTLTLRADAQPQVVEVNDNDAVFDEVDGNQQIAQGMTLGGQSYPAGTSINTAYDLLNTGSGHKVTSLHFGGNGYQQGAVDGLVSTEPLVPGQSYTFNAERTSHRQSNEYDDFVACFAAGTRIDTADGPRSIETLFPGDMICTRDHGLQPLLWRGERRMRAIGQHAPVQLDAGVMGATQPIEVSPEHRLLITGAAPLLNFGQSEVLVPAKALLGRGGVRQRTGGQVVYMHLLLENHAVIRANGVWSETLLLTGQTWPALRQMTADQRLLADLPAHLARQAARPCLKPAEAALMAA